MSLSKVDICNIALTHIGETAIRALDETNRRARICQTAIDVSIKAVLADLDWTFARRLKALNENLDVTAPTGYYLYTLPSDCLVPRDIDPKGSRSFWEVSGRNLLSTNPSEVGVNLYYTSSEISVADFSHVFAMAVAAYVAFFISPALKGDKQFTASMYEMFKITAADAWHSDTNIGNDYITADRNANYDSWVDVE